MPPRAPLTLPTTSALPGSLRLSPMNPLASKTLLKLSRSSLLLLVQEWLEPQNQWSSAPSLAGDELDEEEEALYGLAQTLDELRETYLEMQERKGGKREVVDRVLEGDWRRGLSLQQMAMADMQYLLDHPTSERWTALKLVRVSNTSGVNDDPVNDAAKLERSPLPYFQASGFLKNLQREVSPLVKAHYYLSRASSIPVNLLRIHISDSPYGNHKALASKSSIDASKPIYVAFPDNTPLIYISTTSILGQSAGGDGRSLRKIVIDALPKAFSRPRERYTLKTTLLSARSLSALVALRGPGRSNVASGGWNIFADGTVEKGPLSSVTWLSPLDGTGFDDKENMLVREDSVGGKRGQKRSVDTDHMDDPVKATSQKKRNHVVAGRFGHSGIEGDGKAIERFEIRLEDPFISNESNHNGANEAHRSASRIETSRRAGRRSAISLLDQNTEDIDESEHDNSGAWAPQVQVTFHGSHVFAGLRKLAESGALYGEKMPGWMTGENGVSIGVVRNGRIRGNKGSGI